VDPIATELEALDQRLKTLLPAEYQDSYETMQPTPMRSAGLKYAADGSVAWEQMWGSFCDLAMAGGPPHKGKLLGPGLQSDIDARFDRYDEVAEEICRGIRMVTGLRAYVSPTPGWVRVACLGDAMAGWLLRAIVMENVAAHREGSTLDLPAAPHFTLEKEIKNVITVTAKTCHYWLGHMPRAQQQAIAELLLSIAGETPLIEPELACDATRPTDGTLASLIANKVERATPLRRSSHGYADWLGFECAQVRPAVWMMRGLVASNILARREETVLFVPVNPRTDADGAIVSSAVTRVAALAAARGVL
jgi:sirohydrochlorin cobaltochelatase